MSNYEDAKRRLVEDEGYTVTRVPPSKEAEAVATRTHPRQNSFDQSYMKGRFPMWVRHHTVEGQWDKHEDDGGGVRPPRPTLTPQSYDGTTRRELERAGYNRPLSEEAYVNALHEFFEDRLARWPGTATQKEWVRVLMFDRRSQDAIAEEEGITQAAVSLGRSRAVEKFVAWAGGKAALAEALRQYLVDRESQDGRDRLKYLPRWVHG
jgi:hypothetical protein